MDARVAGVMDFCFRILYEDFEEAAVLVFVADTLGVLFKLGRVVSLRENVLEEDGMGYADRLQVLHRGPQCSAVDVAVPLKTDAAHFDLRAFLHHERDANRSRGNGSNFRADAGKLPTMLS